MSERVDITTIYAALNAECEKPGGQAAFAKRLGVSAAYINEVVNGTRGLTNRVLVPLGFRRITAYERIDL